MFVAVGRCGRQDRTGYSTRNGDTSYVIFFSQCLATLFISESHCTDSCDIAPCCYCSSFYCFFFYRIMLPLQAYCHVLAAASLLIHVNAKLLIPGVVLVLGTDSKPVPADRSVACQQC